MDVIVHVHVIKWIDIVHLHVIKWGTLHMPLADFREGRYYLTASSVGQERSVSSWPCEKVE